MCLQRWKVASRRRGFVKLVSDFRVAYGGENWAMRTRRQVCVVPQGQEANPGIIVLLKIGVKLELDLSMNEHSRHLSPSNY